MAKADPPVPSCKPTAAARAVTVAECEDGIPPELTILLESHLFSLTLHIYKNVLQRRKVEQVGINHHLQNPKDIRCQ